MITKLNFADRTIKSYAIRKLTPKECFRLMGVRENVIGTMQSSNAQADSQCRNNNGRGYYRPHNGLGNTTPHIVYEYE